MIEGETFWGTGEPYEIYPPSGAEVIPIESVTDLVDNSVSESRDSVVRRFGLVGWENYVQGMTERGLGGLVRVANLTVPEFALIDGVEKVPGQA